MSSKALKYHQWCISDSVAMSAYLAAIRETVRPGDIVLDLGAGTGVLSYMACSAGAGKVYAVEPEDIAAVIPQAAFDNGFADRVVMKKTESFDVQLPEKADVLIASMLALAGIGNNMIAVVIDARDRLLKPGRPVIPERLVPVFCPVEMAEWYAARIDCWNQPHSGFRWDSIRQYAANQPATAKVSRHSLLAVPASFPPISLSQVSSANIQWNHSFRVDRSGTLHALAGWVEVTMKDRIRCSNSPLDEMAMPWDHLILPLERAVAVNPGEEIVVHVSSSIVGRETILGWDVSVRDVGGSLRSQFNHSSFHGQLLAKEELLKSARSYSSNSPESKPRFEVD
jgi:hypothetical protein